MSETTNKVSLEVRERVIRLAVEGAGGQEIVSIAAKIGCASRTLNEEMAAKMKGGLSRHWSGRTGNYAMLDHIPVAA